ncbi:MAG TPA: hypothetical protein PLQ32_01635 [Flavihumibacter sp.]|nr:hypothetical protein [Flavihumibacter sp.]HPZ86773.1 hypothetical protein [Flavihumibacter sp.]
MAATIETLAKGGMGALSAMPGYQLHEYQLVIALPEALREKLRRARQQFHAQYQLPGGNTVVMLPLVKFKQRQLLEERMRNSLQKMVSGWKPLQLHYKDFSSQPTHSIFIPMISRQNWQPLLRDLKSLQYMLRPDKEQQPFFISEPVFTLASRLAPGIYDKAWQQYAHRQFTAQFKAEACLLLKRSAGDSHWQILQRLEWRNLPIGVQQASLFA